MEEIMNALYGLIATLISGLAAYLAVKLKNLLEKKVNTKIKKDVARTVVTAVEQIYKDLHGEEKYNKAVEALSEMLAEKGIAIGEFEIRMLIESAVNEINSAYTGVLFSEEVETEE